MPRCYKEGCKRKLDSLILFRYECPGCKQHFCTKHLDWKFCHDCPKRDDLESIKQKQLENKMPRIVANKVEKF